MNRKRILLVVFLLVAFGIAYYFYGGSSTPKGQPRLVSFSSGDLTPLKGAFNDSASSIRVVVMLSPTWAYCLQGASATEQLLQETNGANVRVFVVWEPVLPTDFAAPSTAALARIPDVRAAQYWDRQRALSHLLGERDRSTVVWDHIAVYAPGKLWQDAPPKPVYSDHPVRDVISGAKDAIKGLVASGTNPAGGGR